MCGQKAEGDGGQPGQQLTVEEGKSRHTRERAPDILCVQNRPCAEDVIRLYSALLDKKVKKKKMPHLLTGGGEEQCQSIRE